MQNAINRIRTSDTFYSHPVLHFNFGQCADATGYENFANSFAARIEAILAEVGCGYNPALKPAENFCAGIDFLMITGVSNDVTPDKPVWLVGLSAARDTRRFVEGVV